MAFTPEDGTGVSGANSLVSLADANDYYSLHDNPENWDAASDARKQAVLVSATKKLSAAVVWKGAPVNPGAQTVDWPRIGVTIYYQVDTRSVTTLGQENVRYQSYNEVASNIVPVKVKEAVCEYARYLLAEDRDTSKDSAAVRSEQVGPMKIEYFEGTQKDLIPDEVIRYVRDYVLDTPQSDGSAQASAGRMRRTS